MAHAHPDPRSGSRDTKTIQAESRNRQAAEKRAAYIARVVAKAPPLTPAQIDRLAGLFTPQTERVNATTPISTGTYQSWQMKRYEDAGKHGYYTANGEAA